MLLELMCILIAGVLYISCFKLFSCIIGVTRCNCSEARLRFCYPRPNSSLLSLQNSLNGMYCR